MFLQKNRKLLLLIIMNGLFCAVKAHFFLRAKGKNISIFLYSTHMMRLRGREQNDG
jgi:hypothetical protein